MDRSGLCSEWLREEIKRLTAIAEYANEAKREIEAILAEQMGDEREVSSEHKSDYDSV